MKDVNANTLIVGLMGFATVIYLAASGAIADGETVSAVAAVLTTTIAIHGKGGKDNDG